MLRCDDDTAVDDLVIDADLAIAIGTDAVGCEGVLSKTHGVKIRSQWRADKGSLAGLGNCCNLFIYKEITGHHCDRRICPHQTAAPVCFQYCQ